MDNDIEKTDIESSVESYLGTSDFTVQGFEVKKYSDKPLGFLGRYFKITATAKIAGETQALNFFAKLPPVSVTEQTAVASSNYFIKEVFFYSDLAPKLNSVLPRGTTIPAPKCVLSRLAKDGDVMNGSGEIDQRLIILEDVSLKGYQLTEIGKPLDLAHCQCVLKSLSRFHASSILLEESLRITQPTLNASKDIFKGDMLNSLSTKAWSSACAENMADAVSKIWPDRFKDKTDEMLSVLLEAWERYYVASNSSKKYTNVLCHNDLWTNNMLFAYDSKGELGAETPVDVLFVDYQLVRYSPPALDIITLLYLCTDRKFRDENFKGLLEYYYSCMEEFVCNDVLERVFPFSSLVESVDEFMEYGIVRSTAYLQMILEEIIPRNKTENGHDDLMVGWLRNRGDQIVWNCSQSDVYKERVEASYEECLQRLNLW